MKVVLSCFAVLIKTGNRFIYTQLKEVLSLENKALNQKVVANFYNVARNFFL